jgi:hypothetical protein
VGLLDLEVALQNTSVIGLYSSGGSLTSSVAITVTTTLHAVSFGFIPASAYVYIFQEFFTYLLTSRSTILLEKLTGSQLGKKFPALY